MKKGPSSPTIFGRPALYTAVVGVLAIGAGVVLGLQAKQIADRAPDTDGNGIANITRKERIDLKSKANLSTALLAGGAAVAGGSVLWLVRHARPERGSKGGGRGGPGAAAARASSTALHLLLGGSF